ncbi:MAG: hypothetical protein JXR37_30610 [Kiritimatiellae bacterium]|nr:hypothetical protein [Kiritimatiellia bacterium]
MSRQIALDTLNLRPTPRLAHTEYLDHDAIVRKTLASAESDRRHKAFFDAWDYDLVWSTSDGPVPWAERGRVTDMGHAEYMEGGRDRRDTVHCPFEDPEQVLEFDAVKEYGLPDFDGLVRYYEDLYQRQQAKLPNQLVPGGYYKSVVSGAIQAFGWDMLLPAAADRPRFAEVLRSFGRLTLHHVEAWARTSIEAFIQHDDFVWTEGPFMAPDFYRAVIIPQYKSFWDVLHRAGKKVLFCSDGRFDMFMADVAAAGADGFIFEPCNPLDEVVARFGRTHCLVGSKVDCRTMTFRSWAEVKREMDATFALAPRCAGLMWAVGNHIPHNIPVEILERYIDYLRANWALTPQACLAAGT